MNVLFTCGGTAGHVNPAVALARIFQERCHGCQVLFVGADGGVETRLIPKEGYAIQTVTITNLQRSLSPAGIAHNARTLVNMQRSKTQAKRILDHFRPDLVVGTGGYASYPVVKQAAKRGIPTAVHESNAVPGLTTKMLSKVTDLVMVGFEESRAHYSRPERVIVTGTPVRGDFFQHTRQEARRKLGMDDNRPLILSYWGSLGAEVMNRQMVDFIVKEHQEGVPCRHIHGAGRDFGWMKEELLRRGVKLNSNGVEVREYIYDMPLVMAAADLVLCRAGASTISELTAIGKPSILVPSPNVTANHQEKNARLLAGQGGAALLLEADCTDGALYQAAMDLVHDKSRREKMAQSLNAVAQPDAGENIYQALMGLLP